VANPEHEQRLREAIAGRNPSADLSGLDLSGVRIPSARLEGINLSGTNLQKADLSGAYLRGCNLTHAQLGKARLVSSDLREADLTGADLTAADLTGAILTGAKLSGAKLVRAKLVKARVNAADLAGADLDRVDLRGAQGLTESQLSAASHNQQAILDERMLAEMRRTGDVATARHGLPKPKQPKPFAIDLRFADCAPQFGDVFQLCGGTHPQFAPTGQYGFENLADLHIEQFEDYFAICIDGDPIIWIYPLVKGEAVQHHPGPFDGLRIELAEQKYKKRWERCVARFHEELPIAE
jgi:hypothetical protein